jgi:hypothetical protein
MEHTKYLVVGSSHAALEAVSAIRMHDAEGSLMLLTRDTHLPYSPTVLPYVVSGRSAVDDIFLRDDGFFAANRIEFKRGAELKTLRTQSNVAELEDGSAVGYEKILLATGAAPAVPSIAGIDTVSYHVLRTLDDATRLNAAIKQSRQAVVLGAGLVGMHAAENLVKAGAHVTIVEMARQLTDGIWTRRGPDRKAHRQRRRSHRQSCGAAGASTPAPPHFWKRPRWKPAAGPPRQAEYGSPDGDASGTVTAGSWSTTPCKPALRMSGPSGIAPRPAFYRCSGDELHPAGRTRRDALPVWRPVMRPKPYPGIRQ